MYHIINLSGSIFPVKAKHGLEGYGMGSNLRWSPLLGGEMEGDKEAWRAG